MKDLPRILNIVNREVWAIIPEQHLNIRAALDSYLKGNTFPELLDKEDAEENPRVSIIGSVSVMNLEGTLVPKASNLQALCGMVGMQTFQQDLKAAAANASVKTILLNIASGGGVMTQIPETAKLIAEIAKTKEVVAYTGDVIGSAAYYLASQANRIYASESARIGSIGVFLHAITNEEQFKKEGLTPHLFTTGPLKGMGADGLPLTEEQKAHLQKNVEAAFAMFKAAVIAKRPNVKPSSMTGGVYFAEEALQRGLIDGIVNDPDALISVLNG